MDFLWLAIANYSWPLNTVGDGDTDPSHSWKSVYKF